MRMSRLKIEVFEKKKKRKDLSDRPSKGASSARTVAGGIDGKGLTPPSGAPSGGKK